MAYPEPSAPYVTDEADILHDIRDLLVTVTELQSALLAAIGGAVSLPARCPLPGCGGRAAGHTGKCWPVGGVRPPAGS